MKTTTDARDLRPSKASPRRSSWGMFAWVGQFALLGLVTVAAADRPHFVSHSRDGAITIDGRFDDWPGGLEPFGNDPVSIQVLNDGEFLYLRLAASDAGARMQIMRQGLTVWLDPSGGTRKTLGIRYPVVERGSGGEDGRRGGRGGGFGGSGGRARPPEGGNAGGDAAGGAGGDDATAPSDRVDILGPGKKEAHSLMRDHLPGVDVAVRMEQGTLQYELKVPLAKTSDRPYAIEAQPGKTIGLGLETAKMQQSSFGSGRGGGFGGGGGGMGGRGGGGRGGRGGGGMGRGGGGQGERSFQPPKPLKGWATVTLRGNGL